MNHPLISEKATAALVQALPFDDASCVTGLGSAAAFMLRSLTSRLKRVALVDISLHADGEVSIELALSVWDTVQERIFPLDFSFAPFPYDARTLIPFRVRTWHALAQLYSGAAKVLKGFGIPHFAWLGGIRFWSELVGALEHARREHSDLFPDGQQPGPEHWNRLLLLPPQDYTIDIVVPLSMEAELLGLSVDFDDHGTRHPLERFFVHSVAPGRLAQIVANNFPEFGQGVDVRHLCSNCVVMNVYFYTEYVQPGEHRWVQVSADAPPCVINRQHIFPLTSMDSISGFPKAFSGQIGTGFMPHRGLHLLAYSWDAFFRDGAASPPPCRWEGDSLEALAFEARLGPVSAFVARDLAEEDLGTRPQESVGTDAPPPPEPGPARPAILASLDFSEGAEELEGAQGWFEYMERRMSARRPAMQGFQQKIWMKRLMQERGVPIPRLLYTSDESPQLPFDPPDLPQILEGYCVKPAHLAESHHTFAITAAGVNLLTGEQPTLEEVQDNISLAWGRGLGDYDQTEGIGCATSGVHRGYIEGRSCTNWALYNCPPGVVVEELAQPSPFYANFQTALFSERAGELKEPPDEIKCHVVWGKLFVAEWVTPKLMLGYIFRHGFVKNTIVITPEYQRMCYGGERIDAATNPHAVCNFPRWWAKVVEVAERAVPKGVDYMRVDIFPNGWSPVINELSVAGYSTLLEDWMLQEMLRRVREGYHWRKFGSQEPDGAQ